MLTDAELTLRKVALILSVLLVLVGLWGGARLLLLSEPEPVLPAASSLIVGGTGTATAGEELPAHFVSRPVFWIDRTAYVAPPRDDGEPEPEPPARNGELDKVQLLGMFGSGPSATAIVMHKGKARRLKLNESLEGWTFAYFSPDGAFFEKDMESRALRIEHAASSAPRPSRASRAAGKTDAPQTRYQGAFRRSDQAPARDGKKSSGNKEKKEKKEKKKKSKNKSDKNKEGEK